MEHVRIRTALPFGFLPNEVFPHDGILHNFVVIRSKRRSKTGATLAGIRTRNTSPERVRACDSSPCGAKYPTSNGILIISSKNISDLTQIRTEIPS